MSVYFATGVSPPAFLCSNSGWSGFGEWADSLDCDKYPTVVELWEHGLTNDAADLAAQLVGAVESVVPEDATVEDTVRDFAEMLSGEPPECPVLITDGTAPPESDHRAEPYTPSDEPIPFARHATPARYAAPKVAGAKFTLGTLYGEPAAATHGG